MPHCSGPKNRTAQLRKPENVFLTFVATNAGLRFVTVEKTENVFLQQEANVFLDIAENVISI